MDFVIKDVTTFKPHHRIYLEFKTFLPKHLYRFLTLSLNVVRPFFASKKGTTKSILTFIMANLIFLVFLSYCFSLNAIFLGHYLVIIFDFNWSLSH